MKTFRLTIATALLALLVAAPAAGRDRKDDPEARRERTEKQAARLAKDMNLDDETTAWFKPIYVEMQDSLQALRRPAEAQQQTEQKPDELTDLQAAALIEDRFAQTEKEVAVKRYYYKQLCEKISPKQLLRLFASQPQRGPMGGRQGGGPQGGGMPPQGGGFPGGGFPGGE